LTALAVAGCSSEDPAARAVTGTRLAVYTSMPLSGPDGDAAKDVVDAERLALREAGASVGRYRIDLVSLDSLTPTSNTPEGWDPAQISLNARRAAKDPATIAYIGELDSGASAISVPLLNEEGVLQISPTDTATALTQRSLAVPDSPVKYYPKAEQYGRTFARLVPDDRDQAVAQADYMRAEGVRRLVLVGDDDPASVGYSNSFRSLARDRGITVVDREEIDPHNKDPKDLVEKILAARPDAVFYAGELHDSVGPLWQGLTVADPDVKVFAPGALVDARFLAAVGASGDTTYVTRPVLPLTGYPPAAARFARRFEAEYGRAPAPEALYGYEAMRALLAAVTRAARTSGDRALDRSDVVRAFRGTKRRATVLGDYEILRNGDTTFNRFGAYRIVAGRLHYVRSFVG
jgi:branched-chain amino acid transport system substrate-binding protein